MNALCGSAHHLDAFPEKCALAVYKNDSEDEWHIFFSLQSYGSYQVLSLVISGDSKANAYCLRNGTERTFERQVK